MKISEKINLDREGLEKYGQYELARECAIRHLYFVPIMRL